MEKLILLPESERLYFRMVTLAEWENQFKKKKETKNGANNMLKFGVYWLLGEYSSVNILLITENVWVALS